MPPQYMQGHTEAGMSGHATRNASNTCAYFTALLKPTYTILDVGCGPGSITATLALLVPQGSIIGTDFAQPALDAARLQADLPENCTFQQADVYGLDFPDDSFDVVHTSQVLIHLSDPVSALREMRRVCRPGGFVASREADLESVIIHADEPDLLRVYKRCYIEGAKSVGANPNAGRLLIQWALSAGFGVAKIDYTTDTMTYAGEEREFWGHRNAKQVETDETLRQRCLQNGITDEKGLVALRDGWLAFAANPASVFAMICGQVVCFK